MKKAFVVGAMLSAALLFASVLLARGQEITTDTDGDSSLTNCDQVHIRFDHRSAARDEQDFTIPKSQVAHLEVRPSENGGVYVQGWDRDEYRIKACKAVENGSDLSRVSVSVNGGRVEVKGPWQESGWVVYLLIQAPRDAALDLETERGAIGLRGLNGKIEARSTNGPIDLRQCGGEIHGKAETGPISVDGNTGNLHLETKNGPLSVRLTGNRWDGAGLEGSTQNGPLTLKVPRGFASGIHVEATGHSPFICEARACDDAHGVWRSQRQGVDLGRGSAVVRLSTVNGTVSIE